MWDNYEAAGSDRVGESRNRRDHQIDDPFPWLEDEHDPRTQLWLNRQYQYLVDWLEERQSGIDDVRAQLWELVKAGSEHIPVLRGRRTFFTSTVPSTRLPMLKAVERGSKWTVWDPESSPFGTEKLLDDWSVDPEGKRVAVQTSRRDDERSTLHVLDVDTGEVLDGPIPWLYPGSPVWIPGGAELMYIRLTEPGSPHRRAVWRHRVGQDPNHDRLVMGMTEHAAEVFDIRLAPDGRWLLVHLGAGPGSAQSLWLIDLLGGGQPQRISPESSPARYRGRIERDGYIYLLTTLNAPFGCIVRFDPKTPERWHWQVVVPETPGTTVQHYCFLDGAPSRLAVLVHHHAVSKLIIYGTDGTGSVGRVVMPGVGTVTELASIPRDDECMADRLAFTWTSFGRPPAVRIAAPEDEYFTASSVSTEREVDIGWVPQVDQVAVQSRDGTLVWMFVMGDVSGEPKPTLLTGYGGFGVNQVPSYSASALAWVRAGGIWAKVLARGGAEEGAHWHQHGRRQHKQRTFDDFVAAAEHLIQSGWTTPEQLVATGSSNGGLTVATAVTQRPELFAAASCWAPLCDMLTFDRHGAGQLWIDEYGSPAVDEEVEWLVDFSPYHNVYSGQPYPDMLFLTSSADMRVDAYHSRKMCARLQDMTRESCSNFLLLHETSAGHGSTPVTDLVAAASLDLVFLAEAAGLQLFSPSGGTEPQESL